MSDSGLVIVLLSSISAPRDWQYTDHTRCVWLWSVCINCVVSIVWKGTESLWAAIYQPERLSFINKLVPPEWACCYNVITMVLSIMGWGRQSACYCGGVASSNISPWWQPTTLLRHIITSPGIHHNRTEMLSMTQTHYALFEAPALSTVWWPLPWRCLLWCSSWRRLLQLMWF